MYTYRSSYMYRSLHACTCTYCMGIGVPTRRVQTVHVSYACHITVKFEWPAERISLTIQTRPWCAGQAVCLHADQAWRPDSSLMAAYVRRMVHHTRPVHCRALLWFALLISEFVWRVHAACPNSCSGHGTCGAENKCACDAGYAYAPDCSLRE